MVPVRPPAQAGGLRALAGAANIAIQDPCPGRPVDPIGLMRDGVAWALALDALIHDGPAAAGRH